VTRQLNPAGLALLKMSESCVQHAYLDPRPGKPIWTIAYGHTGPDVFEGLNWTPAQCDACLVADLAPRCRAVEDLTHDVSTTGNQFAAMVDFAYNVGIGALKSSHLLAFHRLGRFVEAAADFQNYNHSNGQVLAGLTVRRQREAELYATPEPAFPSPYQGRGAVPVPSSRGWLAGLFAS
jgi:lysozyme